MLKIQEIREIIELIDKSSINEFVYEQEGSTIKLKKSVAGEVVIPQTYPQVTKQIVEEQPVNIVQKPSVAAIETTSEAVKQTENTNLHKITSPMVGTFYNSPSPDAEEYVKVGSKVTQNTVVCIVEAMKLFNEIEAEIDGEIVEILVKDGQLVEYGQPLFLVKPI